MNFYRSHFRNTSICIFLLLSFTLFTTRSRIVVASGALGLLSAGSGASDANCRRQPNSPPHLPRTRRSPHFTFIDWISASFFLLCVLLHSHHSHNVVQDPSSTVMANGARHKACYSISLIPRTTMGKLYIPAPRVRPVCNYLNLKRRNFLDI